MKSHAYYSIKLLAFGMLVIAATSCEPSREGTESPFEFGEVVGQVSDKSLHEASGLAASRVNPGKFWIHNDSGNPARIWLLDSMGQVVGNIAFDSIKNFDWEDIAVGPGPVEGASYVFVGDIGDNHARRKHKVIYRFPEPAINGNHDAEIKSLDSIRFVPSNGARDTEAMIVDPITKNLYIFSKREDEINAYVLPYPQEIIGMDTAEFLFTLPFTYVTAADISSSGDELLLKTYNNIYHWKRSEDEPIEEMLRRMPAELAYVPEPQGEAIAFNLNATGFYTVTEVSKGERSPLKFYARKKPKGK